jgi:preprotein translocase subunit SecD
MRSTIRFIGLAVCFLLICFDIVAIFFAASRLAKFSSGKASRYGMKLMENSSSPVSDAEIQQTISIIHARLNGFGVDSPMVERSHAEGETIMLLLPPLSDNHVLSVVNADAYIQLRPVPKAAQVPYRTKEAAESAVSNMVGGSDQYEVILYREHAGEQGWVILEKAALVTSHEIRNADTTESGGAYSINLLLTPDAGRRFADWTGQHIGDHLAIVLNDEAKSIPRIQDQIQERVRITGSFTRQSAQDLVLVIRSGPLPRRVMYVSEEAIASNRWTRKYGILTGVFALVFVILIGIVYRLMRFRPSANPLAMETGSNSRCS